MVVGGLIGSGHLFYSLHGVESVPPACVSFGRFDYQFLSQQTTELKAPERAAGKKKKKHKTGAVSMLHLHQIYQLSFETTAFLSFKRLSVRSIERLKHPVESWGPAFSLFE